MRKDSKFFSLFKDEKSSRELGRFNREFKNFPILNFLVIYGKYFKKIIKSKVYLISLQLENNLFFRFQKIICVIEINKLLDIKRNSTYIKFQDKICVNKLRSKKKLFNRKLFHHEGKLIFSGKSEAFSLKHDPIKIQFFIHQNPLLKKKSKISYFPIKNCLFSEKKKKIVKIKISFMRYYSFFLPQYFQSKGLFDSTGRRINSFSSTLNQAFYVLEKIKGSVFPVKLYFLTFFNEIISFLTNFHTGRNYFCDPCCFRKIKNVFKSYLNNILFLKWKILEEIDIWKKKYSSKINTLFFLGHVYSSSDQAFEKAVKQIITSKNYCIYTLSDLQIRVKMLKNPFENLNLYSNYLRACLLKIKCNGLNNICYWEIETSKRIELTISYKISCIYISHKYKETFFENNSKLHEKKLFVLIWIFSENFNFMMSLFHLYSIIFRKTTHLSLEKLKSLIKISIDSGIFKKNFIQREKIKILMKRKNIKLFNCFIQDFLKLRISKLFNQSSFLEKNTNLPIIILRIFSEQRLNWYENVQIFDEINLIKECLVQKLKNLLKNYQKREYLMKKTLETCEKVRICTVQSSILRKKKEINIIVLTVIDLVSRSKIKQIKIFFNKGSVFPLLLFLIMKYRVFSFFFFLKNNINDSSVIYIKNQFTRILNSEFLEVNDEYFWTKFRNIFKFINYITISEFFESDFDKTSFTNLNYKRKTFLSTLIQGISKGPNFNYSFLKKNSSIIEKYLGLNLEFWFIYQFPSIFIFNVNELKINQFYSRNSQPGAFFPGTRKSICELGSHDALYIKKFHLIKDEIRKKYENYFKKLSESEFSYLFDYSQLNFQKVGSILTNFRSLDSYFYLIFKKILNNEMIIKWYYQSAHNLITIDLKRENTEIFRNEFPFDSYAKNKTYQFSLKKTSQFLVKNYNFKIVPKIIYRNIEQRKLLFNQKKVSMGLIKSWRKNFLKKNLPGTLDFLENYRDSKSNIISGRLKSGFHFFIEKLCIFNHQPKFKYLILKKINFFPSRIISVYPRISQIKFSSMIDNQRFLYFYKKFFDNSNESVFSTDPFEFLKNKLNVLYCKTNYLEQFIKNRENQDCFIHINGEKGFNISFIIDKKRESYFYFQIQVFFDKKNFLFIYKWKRKVFLGSDNFYEKLIKPFLKDFFKITEHPHFIACGPDRLEDFIQKNLTDIKKKLFVFTFKTNEFLMFNFICTDTLGLKIKGFFIYSGGKFFWNENEFSNINHIKETLFRQLNKI